MGKLTSRYRRFWGIRSGELRLPVTMLGRKRTMGEPASGPQGRGRRLKRRR